MAAVWMLVCVLTVCLARDLSLDEVSLKKAVALFQSIESRLERDAGKACSTLKVDLNICKAAESNAPSSQGIKGYKS
ncbi:hypothetical protein KUCAC02_022361 [Chaenocephalus aceratus]|uniref:Uncharacterized protein n=1 Tax=Chaenocephalus aceratus TaxID=36190 RepID=A0ACB9XLV0_CHAAC|nr:hypothetical protein KUCAC02_022361 [Chaenocephalus aceratus]